MNLYLFNVNFCAIVLYLKVIIDMHYVNNVFWENKHFKNLQQIEIMQGVILIFIFINCTYYCV